MKNIIRCIVSAIDSNGEPSLVFINVACDENDVDNGWHYHTAKEYAESIGYESYLAYDENDSGGKLMLGLVNWDTVPTIPKVTP